MSKYRIIEHRTVDPETNEVEVRYTIQEQYRAWWKLFSLHWETVVVERGLPGYYFDLEFSSLQLAQKEVQLLIGSRRPVVETKCVWEGSCE